MSSVESLGEADYPLPIGVMTFWVGDGVNVIQPPKGWLICDGAEISKAEYPLLWNTIGIQFGTAIDPVNNFLLPSCIGGTNTESDGKLPRFKSVNTGVVDAGDAGTAALSFTLTDANMPDLPTYDATTLLGIQATGTVWSSQVNNSRNVAENDVSGGTSNKSNTTRSYVPNNTPVKGAFITPTQTNPNMVSRTIVPTAYAGTINLDGEVPQRYEMPVIIKSGYAF